MRRIYRATLVLVMVAFLVAAGAGPVWAQCSMCRTALTESAEGQRMAAGFNNAILFLLGAPYLVFGALAFTLYKKKRKARVPASRPMLVSTP